MTVEPPAVSVVMGTWQTPPAYLREAIRSVLAQTYHSFELIIVEDPSSYSAADVLDEFSDPRIRHRLRKGRGQLTTALREGMEMARAPLIARLDADDICLPNRLAVQVGYLNDHPDVAVVGSRISIIDEEGKIIGRRPLPLSHEEIAHALRRYNCMSHPTVMFRRAAAEEVGGYDPGTPIEDYDLWCRLLVAGHRFANVEEELVRYRFHYHSLRSTNVHKVIRETIALKERYFGERFEWRDRLRIALEKLLLVLPVRAVLWLFRTSQYRRV